jgi:hypothetical protein
LLHDDLILPEIFLNRAVESRYLAMLEDRARAACQAADCSACEEPGRPPRPRRPEPPAADPPLRAACSLDRSVLGGPDG